MFSNPESTLENTHGLSQKIQGTYFKISALYFKIYGLYFSPFGTFDSQQLTKPFRKALKRAFGGGAESPFRSLGIGMRNFAHLRPCRRVFVSRMCGLNADKECVVLVEC